MHSIYIISTESYTGKSLTCIGLGLKLKEEKFKVGYFKPFSTSPIKVGIEIVDEDTYLIKEILELKESYEHLCPVVLTTDLTLSALRKGIENIDKKVFEGWKKISENKDIVLVDGASHLQEGYLLGLNPVKIIKQTDSKVIMVLMYKSELIVDSVLYLKDILSSSLIGVVINNVPQNKIKIVEEVVVPYLKKQSIEVFGILPKDTVLNSISVNEIVEHIGGEILCCSDKLDELVENLCVGAMGPESAIKIFRKIYNKAVITGGDRADLQIAALETNSVCLILTGNLYPNSVIIGKAEEKNIPIIVVKYDTFTTVQILEEIMAKIHLRGEKKIKRVKELFAQNFDFVNFKKILKI